ncbi:MAG: hypothetical protein KIT84_11675 [Labilithrix sp.]|nr:hypothetical protein [Labilithrix sp.]MCW5811669.1 hypothetical protein [Labilithrix sp.]
MSRSVLVSSLALAVVVACGSDDPPPPPPAQASGVCIDGEPVAVYPAGPYALETDGVVPPGLTFEGVDGPVALDSFYEPCAPRSRVLVVRTSGAWCGTCQWHVAHTKALLEEPRFAERLVLLDLLVADRDNDAPDTEALVDWRSKIDAPRLVAKDPAFTFGPALATRLPLPVYVFIDTRTMKILRSAGDPPPDALFARVASSIADVDGAEPVPAPRTPLVDGLFHAEQMDLIRGMQWKGERPPPDPTNAYEDDPGAASLGHTLFEDPTLSPNAKTSCATCHMEGLGFTDGLPQSEGVAKVDRNTPGVALAAYSRWQFWDGRADTLWMQALLPFEDAREHGSSRLFIAHRIAESYATKYDAVFGAKYPLPAAAIAALPPEGKPGDAAYDALSDADKERVTRVFVNVGKALAAFERSLSVGTNSFDAYAGGDLAALSKQQKDGLHMFFESGCAQCHYGPRLTDDAFHVLRFPTGRQDDAADLGRADGVKKLAGAEFLASSKWSDAPSAAKKVPAESAAMLGSFKTPPLRGLPGSAPFGHGGTFPDLLEVAAHYSTRGLPHADPRAIGTTEQWVPTFDQSSVTLLPSFLETLTAPVLIPP